jgi:hypothetical protein
VISHSFAFNARRHLSILVSMLDLSPPLPVFLLLRVGGLSRLNTRAVPAGARPTKTLDKTGGLPNPHHVELSSTLAQGSPTSNWRSVRPPAFLTCPLTATKESGKCKRKEGTSAITEDAAVSGPVKKCYHWSATRHLDASNSMVQRRVQLNKMAYLLRAKEQLQVYSQSEYTVAVLYLHSLVS